MTRAEIHTTTIQRLIEIAVTVERIPGTAPTWHPPDPGDPDRYGVIESTGPGEGAAFRQPIELTAAEREQAICQVVAATTKTNAENASERFGLVDVEGGEE